MTRKLLISLFLLLSTQASIQDYKDTKLFFKKNSKIRVFTKKNIKTDPLERCRGLIAKIGRVHIPENSVTRIGLYSTLHEIYVSSKPLYILNNAYTIDINSGLGLMLSDRMNPLFVPIIKMDRETNPNCLLLRHREMMRLEEVLLEDDYFDLHSNIVSFMEKLVEGVERLHNLGIVVNSLNLQTIWVDLETMHPLLLLPNSMTKKGNEVVRSNKLNYIPPEHLEYKANQVPFESAKDDDVYALGIVYYSLLTKNLPFDIHSMNFESILHTPIRFNEHFFELDATIIQNTIVILKYRMDISTFRQALFQFRVDLTLHHCQNFFSTTISDMPSKILNRNKRRFFQNLLKMDRAQKKHPELLKVEPGEYRWEETVAWIILILLGFGSFFVAFRLCCLERKQTKKKSPSLYIQEIFE